MKLKFVKNLTAKTATMNLYSEIGGYGINGQQFANELNYLDTLNLKEIKVRINSPGGTVMDGYSIFSAIQNATTTVNTYIDGIAASIAGVCAMAGDKCYMADHAMLMIHNPHQEGEKNKKDNEVLDLVKNSLVTIFENKTGIKSDIIAKMMDKETWMDSSTALEKGFVCEIFTTGKKVKVDPTMNVSKLHLIYNSILTKPKMDKINPLLNLHSEASDEAKVEAITLLKEKIKNSEGLTAKVATLEAEKKALETKVETIEAEKKAEVEKTAIEDVKNAIDAGHFKKEAEKDMLELAKSNPSAFKSLIKNISVPKVPVIASELLKGIKNADEKRAAWTIRDWEKNDPSGLEKIANETPDVYQAMYSAFYKKS